MRLDPAWLLGVLLVFGRVSGLMAAAPVFSQRSVPVPLKAMLAVVLSVLLVGFSPHPLPAHAAHPVGFAVAAGIEVLTGLLIGMAMRLVFWAVDVAGEIIGFQMSLSLAQVYNAMSGAASNPMGQLLGLLFLVLFLVLDGPQRVIVGLAESLVAVPLGGARLGAAGPELALWASGFFTTGVRLAMPFIVALLLVDVALGVFARVVPQADLFAISMPAKVLAGLALSVLFVASFVPLAPGLFDTMTQAVRALTATIAP